MELMALFAVTAVVDVAVLREARKDARKGA
jgi:hypothetical protein